MTIITISTVGFGEIQTPSTLGRMFTVGLILGGVSIMLYGLTALLEFVVGGQLSGMYRRRAESRQLNKLQGHYILCGYGRVGRTVAEEFEGYGVFRLSLIHISEPTRRTPISYAVFCLKK